MRLKSFTAISCPSTNLHPRQEWCINKCRAAYQCTRIVLRQVSQESEPIFDLIIELATQCNCEWRVLQEKTGISDEALSYFLDYAAMFLDSLGNYRVGLLLHQIEDLNHALIFNKGHGDRKIIPRLSSKDFRCICSYSQKATDCYKTVEIDIYSEEPSSIGFPDQGGASAYYPCSPDITKDEIEDVQRVLLQRDRHALDNTRLRKVRTNEDATYHVMVASSSFAPPEDPSDFIATHSNIRFEYGDYAAELEKVRRSLQESAKFASNEHQKQYIGHLSEFFRTGQIDTHRQAAISWVQNKAPVVEANIGFLTAYRDPAGLRRSCEGLVAIKNKEESKILTRLTDSVDSFRVSLPWVAIGHTSENEPYGAYENARFVTPDFVSLDG